ncbi:MAG: hypothetical protein U0V70_16550 [Terriglobia bacterium]
MCASFAGKKYLCQSAGRRDSLWLAIRDDGLGFERGAMDFSGMGLIGIEERVKELHGSVEIISQPQKGTVLQIRLPYHPEIWGMNPIRIILADDHGVVLGDCLVFLIKERGWLYSERHLMAERR